MNPENHRGPDSLRAWRVETPLPRSFKSDVWRAIAARQEQPEYFRVLADWIQSLVARPLPALTCAALVLIVGGGSGFLAGIGHKEHRNNELLAKYVQTIDPYQNLLAKR